MLRRTIAALLTIALAILVLPCAPAAQKKDAGHASHDCCAPTAVRSASDCCHSAAPQPATTPQPDQHSAAAVAPSSSILLSASPSQPSQTLPAAIKAPPTRTPATILRT